MGYDGRRNMPQGDRNSAATMVLVMYEIFRDMVFKDLVIYIDDIIIFSDTYDEHLATFESSYNKS